MSELMTKIQKSLPEELDGVNHYAEMAKMADAEGKHGEAGVFRDMAHEEFCHAKHLKMMIHDHPTGEPPANHADMVKKWKEAESAIHDI